MKIKFKKTFIFLWVTHLMNGCESMANLGHRPVVPYGGVETAYAQLHEQCYYLDCIPKGLAYPFRLLDVPLSAVADTVLLPVSVPSYLFYKREMQHSFGYYKTGSEQKCSVSLNIASARYAGMTFKEGPYYRLNDSCDEPSSCTNGLWLPKGEYVVFFEGFRPLRARRWRVGYFFKYDEQSKHLLYLGYGFDPTDPKKTLFIPKECEGELLLQKADVPSSK